MINRMLRVNLWPVIELLVFAGSRLRMAFVKTILDPYIKSYAVELGMPFDANTPASNISGNYYYSGLGFNIEYYENAGVHHYKIALGVLFAGYSMIGVTYLWAHFAYEILYSLLYIGIPLKFVYFIYYWLLFSFLIGGLPVPEESLGIFNALFTINSLEVVCTFSILLGFLILLPHWGVQLTSTIAIVAQSLILAISFYYRRKLKRLQKPISPLNFFDPPRFE